MIAENVRWVYFQLSKFGWVGSIYFSKNNPASVEANGIEIVYDIFGEPSAAPLLLVMGLGGQMIAWDEEFCAALAALGYWVIRFDNRDIGLSTKFDEAGVPDVLALMQAAAQGEAVQVPYLIRDMADDAVGLLDALGTIQPGETTRLIAQLGQDESVEQALPAIRRYRNPEQVDRARDELAAFWDAYLSKVQVETPDANMNSLLNIHNPRQCHTTVSWSRYLSLYQLGLGARGIGFRDGSQDVMGVLVSVPEGARS